MVAVGKTGDGLDDSYLGDAGAGGGPDYFFGFPNGALVGLHESPGASPSMSMASRALTPALFFTRTRNVPYDCVCVGSSSVISSFNPENEQIDAAPSPAQNPLMGVAPPSEPPGPATGICDGRWTARPCRPKQRVGAAGLEPATPAL